jgi:hypothetical protein
MCLESGGQGDGASSNRNRLDSVLYFCVAFKLALRHWTLHAPPGVVRVPRAFTDRPREPPFEAAMHRSQALGLLCTLIFVAPVMLWIAGLVLRLAVVMVNTIFERSSPSDKQPSASLGYASTPQFGYQSRHAIPVPDVGRAMVIMFAVVVAIVLAVMCVSMLLAVPLNSGTISQFRWSTSISTEARSLLILAVCFAVEVLMLAALLPTSLGRAFVVMILRFGLSVITLLLLGFTIGIVIRLIGVAPQFLDRFRP